jgi:hypothetical protein
MNIHEKLISAAMTISGLKTKKPAIWQVFSLFSPVIT